MSRRDRSPSERVDVCIVGSGPAGALTAYSLSNQGYDVVILEAGPRFDFSERQERMEKSLRPFYDITDVWNMGSDRDTYSTSGEIEYYLNHRRVKGVGGSSLHWAGQTPRLHEKDFEMDSRYGLASDWPITYHDLRPYYAQAESEMGIAGPEDNPFAPPRETSYPMEAHPPSYSDTLFREACENVGITLHPSPTAINSEPYDDRSACVGYGTCSPVCPSGAKYSADHHVKKAEQQGCRVIDRAQVRRLEHDSDGETVSAAMYTTPDGETHRQTARQFVVAGGAVETPRLLLLSRSEQYPAGLANSSGLVGKYFMEHPSVGVQAVLNQRTRQGLIGYTTSASHQFYDRQRSIKLVFHNQSRTRLARAALAGGKKGKDQTFLYNAVRLLSEPYNLGRWQTAHHSAFDRKWGDELLEKLRENYSRNIGAHGSVEMLPREHNRITLDSSKTDSYGDPVPDVSLTIGPHERRAMEKTLDILNEILEQMNYVKKKQGTPAEPGFGCHHMGTTRMGSDSEASVVDTRLQTHDLNNLWIVSSSVFVTAGAMNPTLTIGALAIRTAEFLDEALTQS